MNKDVLRNLSYGVYVVSTMNGEKSTGCVANSIMQITQNDIAISIHHENFTNQCIKKCGKFAVSILGVDVEDNVIPVFGFTTGKDIDKFSKFKKVSVDGIDVIEDSIGYIVCEVIDTMEADTHTVFLGKIIDGEMLHKEIPMTYAYYHAVRKGTSPKHAPTYVEEETKIEQKEEPKSAEISYKCKICGYIYNGDITKEAEGYTCPICKTGKQNFEKIS